MLNELAKKFAMTGDLDSAVFMIGECKDNGWYETGIYLGKFFRELFPFSPDILNEMAICAFLKKDYNLCHSLYNELMKFPNLDEKTSSNFVKNHSQCFDRVCDNYTYYNPEIVQQISNRPERRFPQITFTITTCKRYELFEKTMNSFLNCCTDLHLIDKWICVDDNSSEEDRQKMKEKYPFFTFYFKTKEEKGHPRSMNILRNMVATPYTFHMEDDWKFFIKKNYITECLSVLTSHPKIGQCLVNKNYAEITKHVEMKGGVFSQTASGTRYYIHEFCPTMEHQKKFNEKYGPSINCAYWPHFSFRPSLLKTSILHMLGEYNEKVSHFERDYSMRYVYAGFISTFLEGIYCFHIGRLTCERFDKTKPNAYELNGEKQLYGKEESLGLKSKSKPYTRPQSFSQPSSRSSSQTSLPTPPNPPQTSLPTPPPQSPQRQGLALKTYVLNLDRRPDRWEKFKSHPEPRFLNYNRFSAIDGMKLKPTEQLQRIFDGNDYNMRAGMVGCAMSHIQMLIEFLNSQNDVCCILEDDIEFVPDFQQKFISLITRLRGISGWDLCYLGHHVWKHKQKPEYYDKNAMPVIERWDTKKSMEISIGGTGGYIISKKGARLFLEFLNAVGMTNGIDTMQQKSADLLDVYYCTPHLIYSECWTNNRESDTDIQNDLSSLTIPSTKRFADDINLYGEPRVMLTDFEHARKYVQNIENKTTAFYHGKNVPELMKASVHPCYPINYEYLVIVPNPNERIKNCRYFERLKRNGEFCVREALIYKSSKAMDVISMGDVWIANKAVKSLDVSKTIYPFDLVKGKFDSYCLLTEMVLGKSDDELEKFVRDFFDISKNMATPNENKIIFQNSKYDMSFPQDDFIELIPTYTKRFLNFRNKIKSQDHVLFVHVSRYEKLDLIMLYHFLEVLAEHNPNFHFLTVNGLNPETKIAPKFRKYLSVLSVNYDSKYCNPSWSEEKHNYDKVFASQVQEAIQTFFKNFIAS